MVMMQVSSFITTRFCNHYRLLRCRLRAVVARTLPMYVLMSFYQVPAIISIVIAFCARHRIYITQ